MTTDRLEAAIQHEHAEAAYRRGLERPAAVSLRVNLGRLRRHEYSDSCPCSSCCRVRARQVEPRTGQPTDQGSR